MYLYESDVVFFAKYNIRLYAIIKYLGKLNPQIGQLKFKRFVKKTNILWLLQLK